MSCVGLASARGARAGKEGRGGGAGCGQLLEVRRRARLETPFGISIRHCDNVVFSKSEAPHGESENAALLDVCNGRGCALVGSDCGELRIRSRLALLRLFQGSNASCRASRTSER